ncbi:MAG TPA: hypothetical protein VFZ61_12715 [Polyangiales bacterium]
MFQLILPFQLDLPFDPAPEGATAADGAVGPVGEPLAGRRARVRRPRVRARAGGGALELEAQEAASR